MKIILATSEPEPIPDGVFWYRSDLDAVRIHVQGAPRHWMTGDEWAEWAKVMRPHLDESDEE